MSFFKNFVDRHQLPDIKAGIPIGSEKGHDQRFDGRMRGSAGVRAIQVSTISTPASMAFNSASAAIPDVVWL
jgi:hypothetical protein